MIISASAMRTSFASLSLLVLLPCCSAEKKSASEEPSYPVCERLFGVPSQDTGLSTEQCSPVCASCEGSEVFEAATYSQADLAQLRALKLENEPTSLTSSPYDAPEDFVEQPDSVCGITFLDGAKYSLATYSGAAAATSAGAVVTHEGACGACSSLQDLAVYIERTDLTGPVRLCGVQNLSGGVDALTACIAQLGFSEPCANIWAYNSENTREQCFDECIAALNEPYHQRDGSPNGCIQCDEDKSGPVFKAVSGRTRRNSGLPTALCRPCAGVAHLDHHYF